MRTTGLDAIIIEEMYYDDKFSLRDIGEILKYSPSQIGRTLKKNDSERYQVEKDKRNYGKVAQDPKELAEKFIDLYLAGMSMKLIAEKYDYTPTWISKILNEHQPEKMEAEKANRKEIRANRFKKTLGDRMIEANMKEEHRRAVSELSYKAELSSSEMWRIFPSLFKTTKRGFKRKTESQMGCAIPYGIPAYIRSAITYVQDHVGGKKSKYSGKIKKYNFETS